MPDDPSFKKLYYDFYTGWLHHAAKDSARWGYDKKNLDELCDFLTLDGVDLPSKKFFKTGVEVPGPTQPNDPKLHDCFSPNDLEANILHLVDLKKDVEKGMVAGPFKLVLE